jgi:hypothetical protein
MENNPRKLIVCQNIYAGSRETIPYVLVKGIWFRNYGFSPGDQVIITNPEPRSLLMTVHKPAGEMDKERRKKDRRIADFIKSI